MALLDGDRFEGRFRDGVHVVDGESHRVHYVRQPFQREPDFGVTSVNYDFAELLARAKVMKISRGDAELAEK